MHAAVLTRLDPVTCGVDAIRRIVWLNGRADQNVVIVYVSFTFAYACGNHPGG